MRINPTALLCRNIILFMAAFLLSGSSHASTQDDLNRTVTFSGLNITLGQAIAEIEAQTPYTFVFNTAQVNTGTPVRFTGREMSVAQALKEIFAQIPFRSVIRNSFIGLAPEQEKAERANPAARITASGLTNDTYNPSDPNRSAAPLHRPDSFRRAEVYEIERVVTLVPAEPVARSYPAPRSAYRPAIDRAGIYTSQPSLAIKTNLLYGGALLTPNLSLEIASGPKQTFEFSGSYQAWGREKAASDSHKQLAHWTLRPEYRWWTCERFNGHYFGAHALYSRYYVSGRDIPLLFKKEFSYDGHAVGAGFTYGYHWAVGKRWGVEFNIGVGYAYMWYDKGNCSKCEPLAESQDKHYFGPTRAGINLVFMIK